MTRGAVVHVGLEKTGSTAIQAWLQAHRADLLAAGTLVPQSVGSPNHTRLVAACLDDGAVDTIKAHLLARGSGDEAALRHRVRAALDAELSGTPGWRQVVITSELVSSRLHTPSEIARLVDWLGRHVDTIRFVVFLRRQDDLAVSRYSSALRAGHAGFDDIWSDLSATAFRALPPGRVADDHREFFDFERILARFSAVAGAQTTVLAHDPPTGPRDGVAAFRAVLGLPGGGDTPAPGARVNAAMSAEAQHVIAHLNRRWPVQWPDGTRNEPYRALLRRIETDLAGPPRRVPRAEAQAFLDRYAAGNARIEAAHGPLFRAGFDHWPDTVDHAPMIDRLAPVLAAWTAEAARLPGPPAPPSPARRMLSALWRGWRGR